MYVVVYIVVYASARHSSSAAGGSTGHSNGATVCGTRVTVEVPDESHFVMNSSGTSDSSGRSSSVISSTIAPPILILHSCVQYW